jgi:REP element-mobilizing transposase RayT
MEFVDPRKTPFVEPRPGSHLPHLYKPGGWYFVTFRLRDAVVSQVRTMANVAPSSQRLSQIDPLGLVAADEPPLALGSCALRKPEVAHIVQDTLLESDGRRYELAAWCVMPNHVHAVLAPLLEVRLSAIMQSWKGSTSRRINLHLNRTGSLWQRESFDHLIRSADSFEHLVDYVEMNPVVAGLCQCREDWPFSSAHFGRHRV